MDKLNRDKALDTARKVFRKDASDGRQISKEAEAQRSSKTAGRKVTPDFPQSIEKDMTAKAPAKKYGFSTSPNAFQQFSEPARFTVDPALVKHMGIHAKSFEDLYGNVHVDFTVPFSNGVKTEGLQHAHSLRNHARRSGKNLHHVFEQFMAMNHRDVRAEVMVETASQLRFGSIL